MTEDNSQKESTTYKFSIGTMPQRTNLALQLPEEKEENDFITGIDSSGKILGSRKRKERRLVIPLEDKWTKKYLEYQKIALGNSSYATEVQAETEESQIDDEDYQFIMSLPPSLRNRPPGLDKIKDERKKYLYDVQWRPQVDPDAYTRVPIEKFGEAMLRGMGWTEGMPIGKNATYVQPVVTYIRQPQRLGLGATPKKEEKKKPEGWIPKPGESREPVPVMALPKDKDGRVRHYRTLDEKLVPLRDPFVHGAPVFIVGGVHQGIRATVEVKHRNSASVRLPSDEIIMVFLSDLKPADTASGDTSPSSPPSGPDPPPSVPGAAMGPSPQPWVTNDIRVKICSKTLWSGRYYCRYAWVVDVLPGGRCVVQVDGGDNVLEVDQRDLETAVPSGGGPVKVVQGDLRGEVGTVFERDAGKGLVYVEMEEDHEVLTFGYDDVAQYRHH